MATFFTVISKSKSIVSQYIECPKIISQKDTVHPSNGEQNLSDRFFHSTECIVKELVHI